MQIKKLFKRRATVVELVLFSFALGMGSLVCLSMPLLSFSSAVLLPLALAALAYGMWLLAHPESQSAYITYGLTLLGIGLTAWLLGAFGFNVTEYGDKQFQNTVTNSIKQEYMISQFVLFALHTVTSVGVTYGFYALLKPNRKEAFRLFLLTWSTMPMLFVLMHLYSFILPANMTLLLSLWLASTVLITFGAYILSKRNYFYVGAFAALSFFTLPIGFTAFTLFFSLRCLMAQRNDIPLFTQKDDLSEAAPSSLENNPYFARQLKLAGEKIRQASAALDAVEASIRQVDPESANSTETLKMLQTQKEKLTIEKNAAEEMYERRLKLHQ